MPHLHKQFTLLPPLKSPPVTHTDSISEWAIFTTKLSVEHCPKSTEVQSLQVWQEGGYVKWLTALSALGQHPHYANTELALFSVYNRRTEELNDQP